MSNDKQQNQQAVSAQPEQSLAKTGENPGFSLRAADLDQALKVCNYLAKSSMVPKQYQGNPQDILVAISWGNEVGMKPLQALSSIAVINGTPGIYGPALLALVKNSPAFEWILEDNEGFAYARENVPGWEHLGNSSPDQESVCVLKRKGEPLTVRSFSQEDVKRAGLGNVHKSYPKLMRKYRARNVAIKDAFPDVVKGMEIKEVVEEDAPMIEQSRDSSNGNNGSGERNGVADYVKGSIKGKSKPKKDVATEAEYEPVQEQEQQPEKDVMTDDQANKLSSLASQLPEKDGRKLATRLGEGLTQDEAEKAIQWAESKIESKPKPEGQQAEIRPS